MIKWGIQNGKQRYKCKACNQLFNNSTPWIKYKNRFVWFRKWVLERQTYSTLQRDSGLSKDTLQRTFYYFLDKAPTTPIICREHINLRIDATYFKQFCVVCYQDHELSYTQLFRFSDAERYEEIKEDLENLLTLGLSIGSITCDGHKSTIKAIRKVMPDIALQRCLVHIQRMCLIWITSRPKTIPAMELRLLVLKIHLIKTHNDRLVWVRNLYKWHNVHKEYLKERTFNEKTGRSWYTHKLLRRAYYTLKRALPNMFHYLDNPNIPNNSRSRSAPAE